VVLGTCFRIFVSFAFLEHLLLFSTACGVTSRAKTFEQHYAESKSIKGMPRPRALDDQKVLLIRELFDQLQLEAARWSAPSSRQDPGEDQLPVLEELGLQGAERTVQLLIKIQEDGRASFRTEIAGRQHVVLRTRISVSISAV
jgi:hypothetical protein